jgi:UDP-GlcNAc:undecaprenyl-phosphate GlcNAc-1-phosphate transferase
MQIHIARSNTLEELWEDIIRALEMLEFDCGMLYLNSDPAQKEMEKACSSTATGSNRRTTPMTAASICLREKPPEFKWMREVLAYLNSESACSRCLIRIELPLEIAGSDRQYGCLVLIKDSRMGSLSHYSLKRVEHLRRTVVGSLARLGIQGYGAS